MNWLTSKFKKVEVDCYLCGKRVAMSKWVDGSHRFEIIYMQKVSNRLYFRLTCMHDNFDILEARSSEQQLYCPKCGRKMRLWLDKVCLNALFDDIENYFYRKDVEFACNSEVNCGNTERCQDNQRYNCFPCDFDMCILCGSQEEEDIIVARDWGRKESIFDTIIDKIFRFNENRMEREVEVATSLRTLCVLSGRSKGRHRHRRQADHSCDQCQCPERGNRAVQLRDTATSIDQLQCLNGPSEI